MNLTDDECSMLAALRNAITSVPSHIGLAQLNALIAVALEPGISVNELAERVNTPQQTASRNAAILLGRYHDPTDSIPVPSLLEQHVNGADPRKRALFLSPDGYKLLATVIGAGRPLQGNQRI